MIIGAIHNVLYSLVCILCSAVDPYLCNFARSGSPSRGAHPDPRRKPILFDVKIQCLCLLDPDPDPLVRGTDPAQDLDPCIIKQK